MTTRSGVAALKRLLLATEISPLLQGIEAAAEATPTVQQALLHGVSYQRDVTVQGLDRLQRTLIGRLLPNRVFTGAQRRQAWHDLALTLLVARIAPELAAEVTHLHLGLSFMGDSSPWLLRQLAGFPNLSALSIETSKPVVGLEACANLRNLTLRTKSSKVPIQVPTLDLEELVLEGPVQLPAELPHLVSLELAWTTVDLAPLRTCLNPFSLHLVNAQVDTSLLTNTRIQHLEIFSIYGHDLFDLPELRRLRHHGKTIRIGGCPRLQELHASDIQAGTLPALRTAYFGRTSGTLDLSASTDLESLGGGVLDVDRLILPHGDVVATSALEFGPALRTLGDIPRLNGLRMLSLRNITEPLDLSGLEALERLELLDLRGSTGIRSLEPVLQLPHLRRIAIHGSGITSAPKGFGKIISKAKKPNLKELLEEPPVLTLAAPPETPPLPTNEVRGLTDKQRIEEALQLWRRCPHPEVAERVISLGKRMSMDRPPIAQQGRKSASKVFQERLQAQDPLDVERLLAYLEGPHVDGPGWFAYRWVDWPADPRLVRFCLLRGSQWDGMLPLLERYTFLHEVVQQLKTWRKNDRRTKFGKSLALYEDAVPPEIVPLDPQVLERLAALMPAAPTPARDLSDLWNGVYADLEDRNARLVLADALCEQNDPRGLFMQLQLQTEGRRTAQERDLQAAFGRAWLQEAEPRIARQDLEYRDGLLYGIKLIPFTDAQDLQHPVLRSVRRVTLAGNARVPEGLCSTACLPQLYEVRGAPETWFTTVSSTELRTVRMGWLAPQHLVDLTERLPMLASMSAVLTADCALALPPLRSLEVSRDLASLWTGLPSWRLVAQRVASLTFRCDLHRHGFAVAIIIPPDGPVTIELKGKRWRDLEPLFAECPEPVVQFRAPSKKPFALPDTPQVEVRVLR